MKEKIKKISGTVLIILAILFAILWYPWFISSADGEVTCHNIFGITMNCK